MKVLSIIILSVILAIAIPTHDKWSYKAMHDRSHTTQDDLINKTRKR